MSISTAQSTLNDTAFTILLRQTQYYNNLIKHDHHITFKTQATTLAFWFFWVGEYFDNVLCSPRLALMSVVENPTILSLKTLAKESIDFIH